MFRGSDHLHKRSVLSLGTWVGIALVLWVIAWIIAESIPSFNDLLGLIVSLFTSTYIFWMLIFFFRVQFLGAPSVVS